MKSEGRDKREQNFTSSYRYSPYQAFTEARNHVAQLSTAATEIKRVAKHPCPYMGSVIRTGLHLANPLFAIDCVATVILVCTSRMKEACPIPSLYRSGKNDSFYRIRMEACMENLRMDFLMLLVMIRTLS